MIFDFFIFILWNRPYTPIGLRTLINKCVLCNCESKDQRDFWATTILMIENATQIFHYGKQWKEWDKQWKEHNNWKA